MYIKLLFRNWNVFKNTVTKAILKTKNVIISDAEKWRGINMETLEEYLDFAKDIAKYAGEVMMKYFTQNNGASYKGDKTIVTLADTEIKFILNKTS